MTSTRKRRSPDICAYQAIVLYIAHCWPARPPGHRCTLSPRPPYNSGTPYRWSHHERSPTHHRDGAAWTRSSIPPPGGAPRGRLQVTSNHCPLNVNLKIEFSILFYWLASSDLLVVMSSDGFHGILLLISQHLVAPNHYPSQFWPKVIIPYGVTIKEYSISDNYLLRKNR